MAIKKKSSNLNSKLLLVAPMKSLLTAQTQHNKSALAERKSNRKSPLIQGAKRQPAKIRGRQDSPHPQQFQFWYR